MRLQVLDLFSFVVEHVLVLRYQIFPSHGAWGQRSCSHSLLEARWELRRCDDVHGHSWAPDRIAGKRDSLCDFNRLVFLQHELVALGLLQVLAVQLFRQVH